MALALRFEQLLCEGKIRNYAELARLGHVSRARASQIMRLLPARLALWTEFHEKVAALSEQERAVFEMHYYLGLPQAEIAQERLGAAEPRRETSSATRAGLFACDGSAALAYGLVGVAGGRQSFGLRI
jgi:hypothetical protein